MKYFILLITLSFSFASFANDSNNTDQSKSAKVEEMMKVMKAEAMIETIYNQMDTMFKGLSTQLDVKEDEQEIFDKFNLKMVELMKADMGWEKFKEPMINVYTESFTEAEIDGMTTFYKSEIGQSALSKMPIVMQKSMLLSQDLVKSLMPKIQKLSEELSAELENKRASE